MQPFIYDVGVIGTGMAGTFALLKLTKENKDLNIISFDAGAAPSKRRHQMYGFLGLFPNGDGKLYINDIDKLNNFSNKKNITSALNYFKSITDDNFKFKITKDSGPSKSMIRKLSKLNLDVELNDFVQVIPKEIHQFSKKINKILDKNPNLISRYHTDIVSVVKDGELFLLTDHDDNEYYCKKVLFCVGRSGWRVAQSIFKDFNLELENDFGKYGVRLETSCDNLKEFNKSSCTVKSFKNKVLNWEIGPFSWNGTVIPEDHQDTAIASFRSNENRWKTDKVSFNLFLNNKLDNKGMEEVDRLAKLTFILTNDRVSKEKVSSLINKRSKVSILSEYNKLIPIIKEVSEFLPQVYQKCHFHAPSIMPLCGKVKTKNFQTDVNGLYIAGETLGESGLLFSALSGLLSADSLLKGF